MLHFICESDEVQGVIINLYKSVTLLVIKVDAIVYLNAFLTFIVIKIQ
jgi:hypothetical protein